MGLLGLNTEIKDEETMDGFVRFFFEFQIFLGRISVSKNGGAEKLFFLGLRTYTSNRELVLISMSLKNELQG